MVANLVLIPGETSLDTTKSIRETWVGGEGGWGKPGIDRRGTWISS